MSEATKTQLRLLLDAEPPAKPWQLDLPNCQSSQRFWTERAASEFSAVPAFAQTALAMVRESQCLDALGSVAAIVADEVRHAELSRELAEAFGGYDLDTLDSDPRGAAAPQSTPLSLWLVSNGCIGETVSLALLKARLRCTQHPQIKEVLAGIAKDEALHTRIGWHMAETHLPTLSQDERNIVAHHAGRMLEAVRRTFATSGLSPVDRKIARRVRQVVADQGFGAIPADEADAIVEDCIDNTITPRLALLGVSGA